MNALELKNYLCGIPDEELEAIELYTRDFNVSAGVKAISYDKNTHKLSTLNVCSCVGCDRPIKGRGLCSTHLTRWVRHGNTQNPDDFYVGKNSFTEKDNWIEFSVAGHICKIDKEDLPKIQKYTWLLGRNNYLSAHIRNYLGNPKSSSIFLHYFVLQTNNTDRKIVIDHINRDIYDNRKENLRIVPASINSLNTTAKGVYLKPNGTYQAQITVKGKRINLGSFKTYEEGKAAYESYKSKIIENHADS